MKLVDFSSESGMGYTQADHTLIKGMRAKMQTEICGKRVSKGKESYKRTKKNDRIRLFDREMKAN